MGKTKAMSKIKRVLHDTQHLTGHKIVFTYWMVFTYFSFLLQFLKAYLQGIRKTSLALLPRLLLRQCSMQLALTDARVPCATGAGSGAAPRHRSSFAAKSLPVDPIL